jgi:hypothetical protein
LHEVVDRRIRPDDSKNNGVHTAQLAIEELTLGRPIAAYTPLGQSVVARDESRG